MRFKFARGAAVIAATLVVSERASADVAFLNPVADNTIYSQSGNTSNGAGEGLFVGRTNSGLSRRALLRFDLAAIPPDSIINSATLTLNVTRSRTSPQILGLHRLLATWGEGTSNAGGNEGGGATATTGDATWSYRFFSTTSWAAEGADFAAVASATAEVGFAEEPANWGSAQLAQDVRDWLANPSSNAGWIVIGNEGTNQTAKRFASREYFDIALRPVLLVDYTPPGGTNGACCLPSGTCITTSATSCAAQGGVYQGDNAPCTPNPCPQPTGVCCLSNGSCQVITAAECATLGGEYQGNGTNCVTTPCAVVLEPFVDPLPIPQNAQPQSGTGGGAAHYVIAMTEFFHQMHRDLPSTRVWGYGSSFPGPTIRARKGLPVTVEWVNDLRTPQGNLRTTHYFPVDECVHGPDLTGQVPMTVVHVHGAHTDALSDGYPENEFPPGSSSGTYTYPNNQNAATLWYHDHGLGLTRLNVYMGLAGFYLLRDSQEDALNIPRGAYEVPLAIQDRSFNTDGTLKYTDLQNPTAEHDHFFGDFILVNGKVWPYLNVRKGKYRFRVLNGSNSRFYTLSLSNQATFWQIGSDQGLLNAPAVMSELTIAPGERADIIVDFAPYAAGTEIVLQNSAPAPFPGPAGEGVIPNVMKFVVQAIAGDIDAVPATLGTVVPMDESESVKSRDFLLRRTPTEHCDKGDIWAINDLMWDDITDFPRLGTAEVWNWINASGVSHPMHMHLVQFQVLDRQDFEIVNDQVVLLGERVPPPPGERGWKDTVQSPPNQVTRVIARFEDYLGLFSYHCHLLEHEDHEMMRQFKVVCPGDFNADGFVTGVDFDEYVIAFEAGGESADFDGDGFVTGIDYDLFVQGFEASCG